MKLVYEISSLALEDLDSIWEFTRVNWSIDQADKYYFEILSAIDLICQYPEMGESINPIKELHRKMLVGSHMIIYQLDNNDDRILIDRILHQRMDFENLLGV